MPVFTINEVGSTAILVATFFGARRLVENDVANWIMGLSSKPISHVRKNQKTEHKIREASWKFIIHLSIVLYGLVTLVAEDFLFNARDIWIGYPNQPFTPGLYWYYMLELAYYSTEILTHFIAVQRKDYAMMLLHHIVTFLLITVSYYYDFFRVGVLLMLYHDVMDPFLEIGKIAKYLQREKFAYAMFMLLTISYFYTRLFVIPFYVWRSIIFDMPEILFPFDTTGKLWNIWILCNCLIAVLMALNVMWAYFLISAIRKFSKGEGLGDTRSDDENED